MRAYNSPTSIPLSGVNSSYSHSPHFWEDTLSLSEKNVKWPDPRDRLGARAGSRGVFETSMALRNRSHETIGFHSSQTIDGSRALHTFETVSRTTFFMLSCLAWDSVIISVLGEFIKSRLFHCLLMGLITFKGLVVDKGQGLSLLLHQWPLADPFTESFWEVLTKMFYWSECALESHV